MKNKFIQKEWGKCLFYCLANLYNDETILFNSNKEGYHIDGRRVVEKATKGDYTLGYYALHSSQMQPIKDANVFKKEIDFEGCMVYIASVNNGRPPYLHSILLLQDLKKDDLIVFDPYFENAERMSYEFFLNKYELKELETIIDFEKGSQVGAEYKYFSHLLKEGSLIEV